MVKYTLNGRTYAADNFGKAKTFAIREEKAKVERIERITARLEQIKENNAAIEALPFMPNLFRNRKAQNEFMYQL